MTNKEKQRLRTATHEAGHAAAAIDLDIPFRKVSIVPDDTSRGRIMDADMCNASEPMVLDKNYKFLLAGLVAEQKVNNKKKYIGVVDYLSGGAIDLRQVSELINYDERIGDLNRDQYVSNLCKMTNEYFDQSAIVLKLTKVYRDHLLAKDELSYQECMDIYISIFQKIAA